MPGSGPGPDEETTYSAVDASQGQTILTTPLRKAVFIGGLVLFVIFAIVMTLRH